MMKTNLPPQQSRRKREAAHLWALFRAAVIAVLLIIACSHCAKGGTITATDWQNSQTIEVSGTGLVRVELPPETLNAARESLEDLRLIDAAGSDVPYVVEIDAPKSRTVIPAKDFHAEIGDGMTTITMQSGISGTMTGILLETPVRSFVKAVRVEGSHDGNDWQELAKGEPVFRQREGQERLKIPLPQGAWQYLRLTIADDRAEPVPFTGAQIETAGATVPSVPAAVTAKSRNENPGETRLALDLGAANLRVASLIVETPEALFTRHVIVAVPEVTESRIRESPVAEGTIYRIEIDGRTSERIDVPVEKTIPSREVILLIQNRDSPPLAVTAVHAARRRTRVLFYAGATGRYTLLTGNTLCRAPQYDLGAMKGGLNPESAMEATVSVITMNPEYKAPETLAAIPVAGASIDTSAWKFRKPVQSSGSGIQQLDLDLDVLAHAQRDMRDVRLVCDGKQMPFLIDRPSVSREIALNAAPLVDRERPTLSRWELKLPRAGLPITRLACSAASPLFKREMRLIEELTDERGEKYRSPLGNATWSRTPERASGEFEIALDHAPAGDTLILETDNGDNPPVELQGFHCYYPLTRVVYKASPSESKPLWLYYGNADVLAPNYDLGLVAEEILKAAKGSVIVGAEENVKGGGRTGTEETGGGRPIFWGVLAVVVVVLLAFVSRLVKRQNGEGQA